MYKTIIEDAKAALIDKILMLDHPQTITILTKFAQLREARQSSQSEPVASLEEWLVTNMPAGTVIGDPKWWARKINNVLGYLAAPQQAIPSVIVSVNHMKESNGNQWWTVNLSRNVDDKPWDGIDVYTDKIEGRALYEAARLRHFFGQGEKPFILDFDTDMPASPTAPIESDK